MFGFVFDINFLFAEALQFVKLHVKPVTGRARNDICVKDIIHMISKKGDVELVNQFMSMPIFAENTNSSDALSNLVRDPLHR